MTGKKVIIAWPPLKDPKGYATVSQNRQFQWFKDPFFAYPIIPALASTMLGMAAQAITWVDAIAGELNEVEFSRFLVQVSPDYVIFESPTPLIKRYWEIINGIKQHMPQVKIILCGDHVTALPEESKKNCKADHIVQGGDWHYKVFEIITGKSWPKDQALPLINRTASQWWLYAYKNGNFKYLPGTYIMSAMDCWHRKCTFCSWAQYHKNYYVRAAQDVLNEIHILVEAGFKEIFDDSGTLPVGEWLKELCTGLIAQEYYKHVDFGCNMRFGALNPDDFAMMKKAGFRMILWGLESVNQSTLNKLGKGYNIKDVSYDLKMARDAGLKSHLTVMFGYPWETYEDARRTYDMVKYWLRKGYADSAQATICIPYPGTPLWKEAKERGDIITEKWEDYDMTKPVMRIPFSDEKLFALQRGIYNMAFHPEFILRKLLSIRSIDDLKYYVRIGRKVYDRFGQYHDLGKVSIDNV